jgi:hypothetical protein
MNDSTVRRVSGDTTARRWCRPRRARWASASIILAAVVPGLATASVSRAAATPAQWVDPISASWRAAARWSTDPFYPLNGTPAGVTYDATIAVTGGAYTVGIDAASVPGALIAVDHFTLDSADATAQLQSGTFQAVTGMDVNAGVFRLTAGTLSNTTVGGSGGTVVVEGGELRNVTFAREAAINSQYFFTTGAGAQCVRDGLSFANGATVTLTPLNNNVPAIRFENAQTIGGNGKLQLSGGRTIAFATFAGTLSIGPSATVGGSGEWVTGSATVIDNAGTVMGESQSYPMWFGRSGGGTVVNRGLLGARGPGRTLIEAKLDNTNGVIRAESGGVVDIGESSTGAYTVFTNKLGTLQAVTGGRINVGGNVSNVGTTWTVTSPIGISGATLTGGVLASSGAGAEFYHERSAYLNDVVVRGRVVVRPRDTNNGADLHLSNVTLDGGQIALEGINPGSGGGGSSANAFVIIAPGQTVNGAGEFVFDGGYSTNWIGPSSGSLTLASGITVRTGASGGTLAGSVINYGTVAAQTAGKTLTTGGATNRGTFRASGGGILAILGITNEGSITADGASSRVDLSQTWNSSGTIAATAGATLNLGGTWTSAGGVSVDNATLNTSGTWSGGVAINASNSTVNLGGTFSTPTALSLTGGVVNVTGTMNNASNPLALNATTGSWNLTGTGKIVGGTLSTSGGAKLVANSTTATLDGVDVLGQVDVLAGVTLLNATNHGTIAQASAAATNITLNGGANATGGVISVTTGGTLAASNTWNNAGSITSTGGALKLLGNWTNPGTISAAGGTIETGGSWSNMLGTINVTGGATFTLGGTASAVGSVNVTDSAVNVAGSFSAPLLAGINRVNSPIALVAGGNVLNGGSTLTISPAFPLAFKGGTVTGGTLTTGGGQTGITLQGPLTLDGVTLQTTLTAAAGATNALTFAGAWDNNGTVVANDATVLLGGTFTPANVGTIQRNAGSTVRLTGVLNNTGSTFAIDNVGVWQLYGGTIDGGTVVAPAGTTFYLSPPTGSVPAGLLKGVTLSGNIVLGNGSISVENDLTLLAGTVLTIGTNTAVVLNFNGTHTLGGAGEIVFGTASSNSINSNIASTTLTIGPDITIRSGTRGGRVGGFFGTTISQGLISSRTSGQTITLAGSFNNVGTVEARNGGTITTNAADVTLSGVNSTFTAVNALATNNGTFTVTGGRTFLTAGAFTNNGTLNIGAGSTFTSAGNLTWAGTVSGAGPLLAGATTVADNAVRKGGGTTRVTSLAVASGKRLDLSDGKLILTSASAGTASGGTYSGVQGLVQAGRHGGAWDGTNGIITSLPDAAGGLKSLGVATAGQTGYAGGPFGGVVGVTASDVLVMYTYAGDANLDGRVTGDDYSAIDFGALVPGADGWVNGDFNYDGTVTGDDYSAIDFAILAQGAPFPKAAGGSGLSGVTAVPEPTAVAAIVAAAASSMLRRRRRACGEPCAG